MNDKQAFAAAAARAETWSKQKKIPHTHTWICTYEVCGVGPTRAELVAASLRRVKSV